MNFRGHESCKQRESNRLLVQKVAFSLPCARARGPPPYPTLVSLSSRVMKMRCPFWRRRATDLLDAIALVLSWAASRHASISVIPPASKPYFGPPLPLEERVERIIGDFAQRQYYVTGRLSRELYSPDCVFDGPDPDTPVRGVDKWCKATGGLFYQAKSRIDLLDVRIVSNREVQADWRLEGVLNLPWKPAIKPYTGTTIYRFNEAGFIQEHFELWSISALDAFVSVVWPSFGEPPAPATEKRYTQQDLAISDEKS